MLYKAGWGCMFAVLVVKIETCCVPPSHTQRVISGRNEMYSYYKYRCQEGGGIAVAVAVVEGVSSCFRGRR